MVDSYLMVANELTKADSAVDKPIQFSYALTLQLCRRVSTDVLRLLIH